MPRNILNRKIDRKPRDLGFFKSVHEFMNYYADQMNKYKDDNKKKNQVLIKVHKARITTKQFRKFYESKFTMEK
jgi:hypothetical protein